MTNEQAVEGLDNEVRLLDCMGDDNTIVDAARVSTGTVTGKDAAKDAALIKFLASEDHWTPFEHVVFRFYIRCPIFVARQWFRHRIGSFNEASARYRMIKEEFWYPELEPKDRAEAEAITNLAYKFYRKLVDRADLGNTGRKRAREVARFILPQSMYTEFYWTVNLRSLANFVNLRTDEAAQFEIRQYAQQVARLAHERVPLAWEALGLWIATPN